MAANVKRIVLNATPMGAGIADPPEQHPRWDGEKILPYDSVSGDAKISEHRPLTRDATATLFAEQNRCGAATECSPGMAFSHLPPCIRLLAMVGSRLWKTQL